MTNQIKNELEFTREVLLQNRNCLSELWDDDDMVLNDHIEHVTSLLDIAVDIIDLCLVYHFRNDFSNFADLLAEVNGNEKT